MTARKPLLKDFQFDPEYRKFVLNEKYGESGENLHHETKKQSAHDTEVAESNLKDTIESNETKESEESVNRTRQLLREVALENGKSHYFAY